jgi:hypothetical protein
MISHYIVGKFITENLDKQISGSACQNYRLPSYFNRLPIKIFTVFIDIINLPEFREP